MAKPTLAEKDDPWSPHFEPRIEITTEFLFFSVHPVKYRPFNIPHRIHSLHPRVFAYLKEIGATDIPCSFVVTRLQWRRVGVYCTLLSEKSSSDYVDSVFSILCYVEPNNWFGIGNLRKDKKMAKRMDFVVSDSFTRFLSNTILPDTDLRKIANVIQWDGMHWVLYTIHPSKAALVGIHIDYFVEYADERLKAGQVHITKAMLPLMKGTNVTFKVHTDGYWETTLQEKITTPLMPRAQIEQYLCTELQTIPTEQNDWEVTPHGLWVCIEGVYFDKDLVDMHRKLERNTFSLCPESLTLYGTATNGRFACCALDQERARKELQKYE